MDLKVFEPQELRAVLGALRNVALANDRFSEAERALVEGVARIHDADITADSLEPVSCVSRAHRHVPARRGFMRNVDQFPGVPQFFLPLLGLGAESRSMAASYRALEACQPGSLGRAVYDHFVENGYGTDPQGEIQQAAFQAGFARHDGFTFLLFGILQFHLGLRITPVAKGNEGLFDVPRVLTALQRGASCDANLSEGYDIFANQQRPLEEVRAELGIPPLLPVAKAS